VDRSTALPRPSGDRARDLAALTATHRELRLAEQTAASWREARDELAASLAAGGCPQIAIAAALGISQQAVSRILARQSRR
jgi:hypothetical protein